MIRVVVILLLWSSVAAAQSLSLTFDDGLNPESEPSAQQWNDQILAGLKGAGVSAMVFPSLANTGRGEGINLIRSWSQAGHAVGNHTSRHRSLGSPRVSLAEFIEDVKEAEGVFGAMPTWTPMLRFPYLKEGDTAEKRDGMRAWMRSNGYRPAPVAIDTSDWYFNRVFIALSREAAADKIELLQQKYIDHLLDRATYYDKLATSVLGKSPSHVMLLHVNAINAATLPRVISEFRKLGWTIVDPKTAFSDPLYNSEPAVLPAGESIVWSRAKAAGMPGLRYPAEDSVYEEPKLLALGLVACEPSIRQHASEATASLRPHTSGFGNCTIDEDTYRKVVAQWIRTRPADAAGISSISLGRAVGYPWLSRFIADSALASPRWAERVARARGVERDKLAAAILSDPALRQRLVIPFEGTRYTVSQVTFEKILFGRADEHASDKKGGSTVVPFDAQIWLRLAPRGAGRN